MSFWQSIREVASAEAMASPLAGYGNGPADAYRHLIGTAELRRRFGWSLARIVADGNEVLGSHGVIGVPRPDAERWMDDHNNALALEIGRVAKSYEDVVRMARTAIESALAEGGSGRAGTPVWLPAPAWSEGSARQAAFPILPSTWSERISLHGYRYADERFSADRAFRAGTPRDRQRALAERLALTPPAEWSEEDVKAAIGLPAYSNGSDPEHAAWRARVREHFEAREAAGAAAEETGECAGVTSVRAHSRRGPNGPVHVSAHDRAVPCG